MYQGSCLCGSIKYELESDLKAVVNCHCGFCSKAHGAVFTTLLFIPLANLTITEGKELLTSYHVENLNADRYFCSKCGTRLYNSLPSLGRANIVVATLTTDEILRPLAHVNTESKCTWFQINDELPQFLSSPSPDEFKELLSN
jgi:hypothetical protein